MEKIVSSQLIEHLAANDLLEPLQSAYRSGHSTETALLKVHDDIICAVGKNKAVLVVLLDLSAAFDTVEHSVLLDTLQSLGIDGSVLSWSESYLCDRSQQVTISGKKSEGRKLFCGVPQGSVNFCGTWTCHITCTQMTRNSTFALNPAVRKTLWIQ